MTSTPAEPHFTPALFAFLRELKANNQRDWFQANKNSYEEHVKDAALRFISDFGPWLRKISAQIDADPRPVGGSLFRIYRDVRFARDKSPYKTHVGIHFRHKQGKDAHAPGYYLHLEPGQIFGGAGIWHPDGAALKKIRDAIVARPADWKRVTGSGSFAKRFELAGESLKRVPRGYDPDHPLVEDLKRKDFFGLTSFTQEEATSSGFLKRFHAACRDAAPLMRFLCRAVDAPF